MPAESQKIQTKRERGGAPILVAQTKFCAINIHFQYDAPNERLHELRRVCRHTHSMGMAHVFMVHQFVCLLLCLSIRGFYGLFPLVGTTQLCLPLSLYFSLSRPLSLFGIICAYSVSMFQCCTMFVKVFGWNWFSWVWLQVGKFVHHIYWNAHSHTHTWTQSKNVGIYFYYVCGAIVAFSIFSPL